MRVAFPPAYTDLVSRMIVSACSCGRSFFLRVCNFFAKSRPFVDEKTEMLYNGYETDVCNTVGLLPGFKMWLRYW